MAEDEAGLYLLVIVIVVAVFGFGLAAASFVTHESIGGMMGGTGRGGMMGGTGASNAPSGPGGLEWAILIVSATFLVLAVALLIRSRGPHPIAPETAPPGPTAAPTALTTPAPAAPPAAAATSVPEPTLVKLLDEDEKRMYLELRDHGGEMFQRDIVALRTFSKAKVTRVLDKLEAKGLVVREAHGMTNRVRLVNPRAK